MTSIKNQGRDAPAFQEYAASMMGRFEYRMLTLHQRGLLYTLRLECWVNQSLPSNPNNLAKVLGLNPTEVSTLLPTLKSFFEIKDENLFCPELEDYRKSVQDRRNRQSEGGKESRRRHKEKLASSSNQLPEEAYNQDASNLEALRQDKINSGKSKPVYRKEISNDEWLEEYDRS